jgi:D-alanyl-D-alanine carboxypeptidase/D-alanyl-D-alanine-endopeptidase (penicillin-binding protein 4)
MRFLAVPLAMVSLPMVMLQASDLEHRIDQLAESSGHSLAGIQVVDLTSGKVIYHRNEDLLLLPASNAKLFTSALALLRLGPDYRFTTQVIQEGPDVVLAGSGDPSLSGRVFPYTKDGRSGPALQAIEDLADQMVAGGLHRVSGDVVGDDRLYPWAPYPPSWTEDDMLRDFGAPVSALSVNENTLTITIRPGAAAGDMAVLSLDPRLEYYAIDNRIATVGRGSDSRIRMSREPGSRQLLLWGSISAGHAPVAETIAVDDPALYGAMALYDALTRRGVAISGRPMARHRLAADDYEPSQGPVLASRTSPPLLHLLQTMDKVSQNLFAELMLREVGRVVRHQGTREAGLDELNGMLAELGSPKDDSRLEDGSGLSRNAMITARLMTRLLTFMYGSKYREEWLSLLPVGGEDGTLQHRLCCIADGKGIRAKTGSLSRAIALSGYADSKSRGKLAFSIIVNDFSAPGSEIRAWVDKIAVALLE